jgi:hypothetical protein
MANDIIPMNLQVYRSLLTDALNNLTNEMYANNIKTSYKYDFTAVPKSAYPTIVNQNKALYLFRVFAIDKSENPIGVTHYLYNQYYSKDTLESVHTIETRALKEWFITASRALYNYMHDQYIDEAKQRQAIKDSRAAEGITQDNLKAEMKVKDDVTVKNQEARIMQMIPKIITE